MNLSKKCILAISAMSVSLTFVLAGCNVAGPIAYFLSGPPMTEAEYFIEPRPTVVFVDDRANVITANGTALRLEIAETVSELLMQKELILPDMMISPRDALALVRAKDRYSDPMPIDAIGRMVGAEQIIYIEMYRFTESIDGITPRPTAACQVRVLDVENRRRLFPDEESESQTRTVRAEIPAVDPLKLRSESSRLEIFRALAEQTGTAVAQLFYEHDPRGIGHRIGSQR